MCDTCAILTPAGDFDHAGDECHSCGAGRRLTYVQRDQVPTLTQRLDQLRAQLHDRPGHRP